MPRNDDLRGLIADLTEAQRQLTEELALSGRLSSRFARDHVAILRGIGGRARAGGSDEDETPTGGGDDLVEGP